MRNLCTLEKLKLWGTRSCALLPVHMRNVTEAQVVPIREHRQSQVELARAA